MVKNRSSKWKSNTLPALHDIDQNFNNRVPKENLRNRRKDEKKKKKIETKSPQYYNTNQLLHQGSIPKDNTANVLL